MKRRQFLQSLGTVPLVSSMIARQPGNRIGQELQGSELVDAIPDWVRRVRDQMPVTRERIYFQTGSFGSSPLPVVERVRELMEYQLKGPAVAAYAQKLQEAEDSCRPLIARLFGAREQEVALTHNTTEGMNIVFWSIDWKPGDEIIISNHEHPALMMPSYNLHARFGVTYRKANIEVGEDVVANVLRELSPRTRLVAMSHVSRRNGRVIPAKALADALKARNVRLLLDGAQAAGNICFRFDALGVDYYSLCGHKWLLGPKGAGALLLRKDLLDSTPVSFTGAHSHKFYDDQGRFEWHPDGRRYEYGTRAQFNFGGFAEAMRWLEDLGMARVYARIQELSLEAATAIRNSKKFELVSPLGDAERSGIVVLRLPKGSLGTAVHQRLDREDRILVSPLEDPRHLRVSLHFFNTRNEFATLLSRLEEYC